VPQSGAILCGGKKESMVGNEQISGIPNPEPSRAEVCEEGVRPDIESSSLNKGGSGKRDELGEGSHSSVRNEESQDTEKEAASHFINYVAARVGAKPNVMKAVWAAIVQEAPAYLLEEQRSINMGFVEITAIPYRENWKQILHAKFPKLVPSLKKVPSQMADAYLFNVGWDAELLNSELCEFHRNGSHFGWIIEAQTKRQWELISYDYERKQKARLGAGKYAKRWIKVVGKTSRRIFKYFLNYVAKTSIPCASIRDGGNKRGNYLVPHTPRGKVRPTAPQDFTIYAVNDPQEGEIKSPEDTVIHGQIKEVPPVPLIPSNPKDLWQRGDN